MTLTDAQQESGAYFLPEPTFLIDFNALDRVKKSSLQSFAKKGKIR